MERPDRPIHEFSFSIGSRSYEINRRYVAAVTSIGGHDAECNRLAAYLDLPKPCTPTAYKENVKQLCEAAQTAAHKSTQLAACEASKRLKSSDIRVSVDGTWQRRGFSSKNGVVTVLSVLGKDEGSKVLDTEVLTTYCAGCRQLDNDKTKLSTIAQHSTDCSVNHQGAPGGMESAGALAIFRRSNELHGLRYTEYLGDGDSKAYKTVADEGVYGPGVQISKLECTGHIQKRMGKALMNIVANNKSRNFLVDSNGKLLNKSVANPARGEKKYIGLGGKGRLTAQQIKNIQGHYGAAIRGNSTVEGMRAAIWAIFYHRKGEHNNCPDWCASHQGNMEKADKHRLPLFVCELMKPAFERLADDSILSKCVHGGTQNANEAYHSMLWARCPKTIFCGDTRLKLAVAVSTLSFNDGERGVISAFQQMGLTISYNQVRYASAMDSKRIKKSNQAISENNKTTRQRNQQSNTDCESYEAGAF